MSFLTLSRRKNSRLKGHFRKEMSTPAYVFFRPPEPHPDVLRHRRYKPQGSVSRHNGCRRNDKTLTGAFQIFNQPCF